MKLLALLLFVPLLGACTKGDHSDKSAANIVLPPRLDDYLVNYCDSDGSLSIVIVASHIYDHRFRMQLYRTSDPELKRLYVLARLFREVEGELERLENGVKLTSRLTTRPLTVAEWHAARESVRQKID